MGEFEIRDAPFSERAQKPRFLVPVLFLALFYIPRRAKHP